MSQPLDPEANLPVPFENKEPQVAPFPIVGVGASAGGLEAFSRLLEALPVDTGMAFVLIQHLDPAHKSELTSILSKSTSMKVSEVIEGMAVEPNQVYVIPPNTTLQFERRALHLRPRSLNAGPHLTIDHFFQSLANEQSRLSIGVVLSGTGSDGSEGLKAIKSACGITFAQDEGSAKYPAMPRSAAATGIVEFVMPPAQIAEELARISQNRYILPSSGRDTKEVLPEGDGELKEIFSLLLRGTGVDFSHYKEPTIRRRIARRMVVHRFAELPPYVAFLRQHPEEVKELFRDALINVTSFFRDPAAFTALVTQLSALIQKKEFDKNSLRAWIPGCSTGEEVYSLAICVQELCERTGIRPILQFFGTDIDEGALAVARAGLCPERILQEISSERLNRFFTQVDGKYQISKAIRETCVFAKHDVTRDTPFSHLDLISCRNVLIYLDSVLQKALFPTFHYALNSGGLLFLGTAETVGSSADLFAVSDSKHKIFTRKAGPPRLDRFSTWHSNAADTFTQVQVATATNTHNLGNKVDRIIRDRYAPDAVVIDRDWQILQFRGQTGFYLEPAPGEASYHLLRMARGDLSYSLRDIISIAMQGNTFVEMKGLRVEQGGEVREISIEVTPIESDRHQERFYLVAFRRDVTHILPASQQVVPEPKTTDERVAHLERELAAARRYQRGMSQEHDAAMEELRALNEEVRSANEELQSSNEELGTTKEELQSSNEELTTVNEELDTRNQQLGLLNDDLNNLFSAVNSPVLKVDRELYLRRCTPAAEKLGIGASDLNHPVRDLQRRMGTLPDLELLIRDVIDKLAVQTYDFQDQESRWWSLSIRPYRTTDHRIDGAVLTFTDTDPLQRALHVSDEARRYADAIIETVREPLVILNPALRVDRANASFYRVFRLTQAKAEGQHIYELGNGQWNIPEFRAQLEKLLLTGTSFTDFEVKHALLDAGTRMMSLNGRQISDESKGTGVILLAFEDVTERRKREEEMARQLTETGHELDRTKEELRALAGRLMNAREEQDRRVARELHDDFGQRLALLEITIENCRLGPLGQAHPEVQETLGLLRQRVSELSSDVRTLSHRMHPSVLDDLGLVIALKGLAEEFQLARSAPVLFTSKNVPVTLPLPYAGGVYRIAQEALSNATKYAPGAPVTITLTAGHDCLRLIISDTGPGFNPVSVRANGGLGLVSMQERAHLLGGDLRIQSQPRQGTNVSLKIPLPKPVKSE
jgi:two-component system, chemotaxis family, CheB/CheR fusion protein